MKWKRLHKLAVIESLGNIECDLRFPHREPETTGVFGHTYVHPGSLVTQLQRFELLQSFDHLCRLSNFRPLNFIQFFMTFVIQLNRFCENSEF